MKDMLKKVLQEACTICYEDTKMALELICETLFYEHGIDARHKGRSIYVDGKRVASIKTCIEPCEDAKIIAIYGYTIL